LPSLAREIWKQPDALPHFPPFPHPSTALVTPYSGEHTRTFSASPKIPQRSNLAPKLPKCLPDLHPSLHGLDDTLVRCGDAGEDAEDLVEFVLRDAYYALCRVGEDDVALL
jgi:hypothetical protein